MKSEYLFDPRYYTWDTTLNLDIKAYARTELNSYSTYFNMQSRTLTSALNHSIGMYYGSALNPYLLLDTLTCLCGTKPTYIAPRYLIINEELAKSLSSVNIADHLCLESTHDSTHFKIILCHIPKGKSFLKEILKNYDSQRIQNIERICIENPNHFVRIYKTFPGIDSNSIIVFSDNYTTRLITLLYGTLPILKDIPTTASDSDEKTEEKYKRLHAIFAKVYEYLKNPEIPDDTRINPITDKINEFAQLFDFRQDYFNTFTKSLANARNTILNDQYKRAINSNLSDIKQYENRLEELYRLYNQNLKALNAIAQVTPDDLTEFINILKTNPRMEILNVTGQNLLLRVTAPLQYFQSADLTAYENNTNSEYNRRVNNPILKSILHKIFVTKEYQVLVQAVVKLSISTDSYSSKPLQCSCIQEHSDANAEYTELPNPHMYFFNCWSQAQSEITKNITAGKFELIPMQILAAVQNINIAENASFVSRFLNYFCDSNYSNYKKKAHFLVSTPKGLVKYTYDELYAYEQDLAKTNKIEKAKEALQNNTKTGYTQIEIPDDDASWDLDNYDDDDDEGDNE